MEYFGAPIKCLRPSFRTGEHAVDDSGRGTAVRVFLAEIQDVNSVPRAAANTLCAADGCRFEAMSHPRRRAQFLAGRLLLRHAIERTFDAPADRWRIDTLKTGCIRLARGDSFLAASIAHSRGLVACAIAARGCIGIDVERPRPRRTPWHRLADAVLHPAELAEIETLGEHDRWAAFYRHWTYKEAFAKALGRGLSLGFERVRFGSAFRSVSVGGVEAPLFHDFRFAAVDCGADAFGAIAWCAHSHAANDPGERGALP
ncbi:MAG: 4'-phosphopantetheinyl transferase superfamily protein [Burkholderiales bacterium]|nr:4'-phosphopantetheinyl transferase superfamily protein [Burkholderiales bacterium]